MGGEQSRRRAKDASDACSPGGDGELCSSLVSSPVSKDRSFIHNDEFIQMYDSSLSKTDAQHFSRRNSTARRLSDELVISPDPGACEGRRGEGHP
jgi:hypothetical protein